MLGRVSERPHIIRLIIVQYPVIPAKAGIQAASGCPWIEVRGRLIKSGMTKGKDYYERDQTRAFGMGYTHEMAVFGEL